MKKSFVVVMFSVLLLCSSLVANAQEQTPRIATGGVLNGKAVSLPKPAYPQIARAARVGGTVIVQVTIGEDGIVIAAEAISGHPLLRAASVQAAQGARFSPTLLEGKPVKVTGTIVYNFMMPMSWIEIGAEFGRTEKDALSRPSPSVATFLFSQQFETEGNELMELRNVPIKSDKARVDAPTTKQVSPPAVKSDVMTIVGTGKTEPLSKEEYLKKFSSVISSIQNKLSSDSVNSWYFSLGLIIGNYRTLNGDLEAQQIIERLRNHSVIAPTGVSERIISSLQKLITSFGYKASFDENDKEEINQIIQGIFAVPIERY